MRALKKARKLIEKDPQNEASQVLSALVMALESGSPLDLQRLYQMGYDDFELAIEVLKEWRLDRYYSAKVRLLGLSVQVDEMNQDSPASAGKASRRLHT